MNYTAQSDYTYHAFGREFIDTDNDSYEIHFKNPNDTRSFIATVTFPFSGKKVCWLIPLEMGKGVLTTPTKVLETPNGKINIYETSNGRNGLSSRIIMYWAYDAQTGKFLSYGSKSLWKSDQYDYIRWEQRLLEDFCSVAA